MQNRHNSIIAVSIAKTKIAFPKLFGQHYAYRIIFEKNKMIMKKTNKLLFGFALIASITFVATKVAKATPPKTNSTYAISNGTIKLVNDTDKKLKIHTGTGSVTLNPGGGSTSFTCTPGKSIKADGKEIFKVTDKMCGETIKLSKYL